MSATGTDVFAPGVSDEVAPYRELSRAAVVSAALTLLGFGGLLLGFLLVLPAAGVLLGWIAISSIRRYPEEISGLGLARFGFWVGLALFAGGSVWHGYVYMTEVPDGYRRVSFEALRPVAGGNLPVSTLARELNGQPVFIKGYVHPSVSGHGAIRSFVLVPDMKTCCFGGQPKKYDMIEVTLKDPLRVRYSTRRRKLAGVLTLNTTSHKLVGGLDAGLFKMEVDYVR